MKCFVSKATELFSLVRQAWRVARKRNQLGCGGHAGDLEVKVLYTRQGEVLARGKGVAGDCESEGSPRQNAGLTNRKRIRWRSGVRWHACIIKAQYLHGTLRRKAAHSNSVMPTCLKGRSVLKDQALHRSGTLGYHKINGYSIYPRLEPIGTFSPLMDHFDIFRLE
mgnify:FL=1